MDWVQLLVAGTIVLAWPFTLYLSRALDWPVSRTVGMILLLSGGTVGIFYDNVLSAESALFPWVRPIAAVTTLVGTFMAWVWRPFVVQAKSD